MRHYIASTWVKMLLLLLQVLSMEHRVFYYPNFLTDGENAARMAPETCFPQCVDSCNHKAPLFALRMLTRYVVDMAAEEADHIRELAEPNLVRSKVIDSKTGISRDDSVRTSQSSSLRRSHDEVVAAVDQRIKKWTLMPANHGEGLNVLRYQYGQKYSGVSSSNLCLPWGLAARK